MKNTSMNDAVRLELAFTPPPKTASVVVDIDLAAVQHNHAVMQKYVGGAVKVGAVVKADAYGLGMCPVAEALHQKGVHHFFVATVEEGLTLRKALPRASIFVMNGVWPEAMPEMVEAELTPVLHCVEQLKNWQCEARKRGKRLPLWLQVETGLSRLGVSLEELALLANEPCMLEGLDLKGLMSHLACSYDLSNPYNEEQRLSFQKARAFFPKVPASFANSGGLLSGDAFFFDIVRPGRFLYGSTFAIDHPLTRQLKNVVTMRARILQIKTYEKGIAVGYDKTFLTTRPTRIATLCAGYADGYFQSLSNKGSVQFKEWELPVLGRVSMDLLMVDVSAVPAGMLAADAWVELVNETLSIDLLAQQATTNAWEILTHLGKRPFYHYRVS